VPISVPSPAASSLNQLSGNESEEVVVERENEQGDGNTDDLPLDGQAQSLQVRKEDFTGCDNTHP